MPPTRCFASCWRLLSAFFFAAGVLLGGCASPGPPRAPSLQLPEPVRDLHADRIGDTVELRFTPPNRSTDGQAIRAGALGATLCRQVEGSGPCVPVDNTDTAKGVPVPQGSAQQTTVVWRDTLPPDLRTGQPRLLAYQVELRNSAGHAAGLSEAAYTASGKAPPPVEDLAAQGVRAGVLLQWTPVAGGGEVLLERTEMAATASISTDKLRAADAVAKKRPGVHFGNRRSDVVWLQAEPGNTGAAKTLDGAAEPGVRYRYAAYRREVVRLGGRTEELRSAPSAAVEIAWQNVYPPATPQGVTAVGYSAATGYAVDLIWQPVDDARLAGYVVYRRAAGATGERVRLTPQPLRTPAFHDASAQPGIGYRYEVTAIDAAGNESAAGVAMLEAGS